MSMSIKSEKDIFYLLHGISPKNKLSTLIFNIKNFFKYLIPYKLRDFYRFKIKTIIKPQHSRIRKSIPRHWMDLDYVLVMVNFEIIKSFYEDEYKDGLIDWNSDESHKKFSKWLEKAYKYITLERPRLEKKVEQSYPDLDKIESGKKTYKELYGKVDDYEKIIFDRDTEVIYELLKNREFLWT